MQSQEDDLSVMAMGRYMDRLLTFFSDEEQKERKCTNLWHRVAFHVLAATAEAERFIEDDIETDIIFCNNSTRIAYGTFICTALNEKQMNSVICIPRANA